MEADLALLAQPSAAGGTSSAIQSVPASLDELLAQHGSDPGADSKIRLRPTLLTCLVEDLHVALGMGMGLTAIILAGPSMPMVLTAFTLGIASAVVIYALGRTSRAQGRVDLVLASLLACLFMAISSINFAPTPQVVGASILIEGGGLFAGLLTLIIADLRNRQEFAIRVARILAPLVPTFAALSLR